MTDSMSNEELRKELLKHGAKPGPITETTRSVWLKKLNSLLDGGDSKGTKKTASKPAVSTRASRSTRSNTVEVVTVGDSDEEGTPPAPKRQPPKPSPVKEPRRSSPLKKIQEPKPANSIVPGLAYMKRGEEERSTASAKTATKAKTSTPIPDSPRKLAHTSRLSGKYDGDASSLGYSDSDESGPLLLDRSANTSFPRPATSSTTTYRRSTRICILMYKNCLPCKTEEKGKTEVDGVGKPDPSVEKDEDDEDEDNLAGETTRRSLKKESPIARAFRRISTRGSVPRDPPSTGYGRRGIDYLTQAKRENSGRKLSISGTESWERLSRWLLGALVTFLLVLVSVYFFTRHQETLRTAARAAKAAAVDTVSYVYNYMILPVVFIALACAGVGLLWILRAYRIRVAESRREAVFNLVNAICDVLERQAEKAALGKAEEPTLPVPYVRDLLIPPKQRHAKAGLWAEAEEYINANEGRVRTESEFRDGQECSVWRWLPAPDLDAPAADGWQGHAFADRPAQAKLNTSAGALKPFSDCLKLRGMFDATEESEPNWVERIQDALLEKLNDSVRTFHIAIDRRSKEGCAYMKLGSPEEAASALQQLHGSWYNGRLVSVKYLRPERYVERFPDAVRARLPLHPTRQTPNLWTNHRV